MKKTLSVILALAMMLTLTTVAFAEPTLVQGQGNGNSDQEVTATYDPATTSGDTVYYVTVEWNMESNTLKYSEGDTAYTWNGAEMKYEEVTTTTQPTGQGWEGQAVYTVKVTNQSNAEINAVATWVEANSLTVNCEFDKNNQKLDSAAEGIEPGDDETGTAQDVTIQATVETPEDGTITEGNTKVGTITVTITPVTDAP